MLTKQQAIKLRSALVTANKGSTRILNAVVASKTGKVTASAHSQYSKELKVIKSIAAKAERHLINAFKSPKDVVDASKIEAVEKLLAASAELSMRTKILAKVLADADELSELPDGTAEFEDEIVDEGVNAEGEDITDAPAVDSDDELDELDAEGEDDIEGEGEDIVDDTAVDADDELDNLDAEGEYDIVDEPVEAKRKVSAKKSLLRKKISANAKIARKASVKRPSLQAANRSLIDWGFPSSRR